MASANKSEPPTEHEQVLQIMVDLHVNRGAMRNLMYCLLSDIFDKNLAEFHYAFAQILQRDISFESFVILFKTLNDIINGYRGEPARFYRAFFQR